MPIYEYVCRGCDTRSSVLVRRWQDADSAVCPGCGCGDLERLFSRFAYHRSTKAIHEAAGDPQLVPGPDQYSDPRNIGRWTEKRFGELGVEVPPEIRESIDAAREGEPPPSLKEML
jgi:putative FmdB family regulatory protein